MDFSYIVFTVNGRDYFGRDYHIENDQIKDKKIINVNEKRRKCTTC
jgi:hypothetical protein